MKRLLVVMFMVVCILFIANASWAAWYGWVHYPDGTNAPKYIIVTAIGKNTPNVLTVYTGGRYLLSEPGMIPGKEYLRVEARVGIYYGFAPGGVYQNLPWVEKNIILYDKIANPIQ